MDAPLIPEIILNFGMHLIRRDLTSCIRVCRAWHQVLAPLIYDTVHDLHQGEQPPTQAMDRYGQHIRSLHLSTENFRRVALFRWPSNRCRNLQELAVHVYWDEDDLLDDGSHEELYIKDLVMRNPSISRLTVNGNHAPLFKVFDWNAILFRNGLALKELSLYSVFLNLRSLCTIYDFSRRLFKLELVDCQCEKVALDFSEFFTSDPQFPNLIELTIVDFDDNIIDLEEWIHHCPKLHSLKWSEDMWRLDFENWAQAPIWSNLQSINLRTTTYRHYYRPLTDSQVSYILDGCAPLKKFSVDSVHLWIRFYNSLERHFATVEHIEIPPTTSYSIPQWIWQRILTSCPRLTYLMAGELNACFLGNNHAARARRERERLLVEKRNNDRIRQEAGHRFESRSYDLRHWTAFKKDMENVRPWVCRKLESLYLSIGGMPELLEQGRWDESVFAQISGLKELKVLDVASIGQREGLNFSLVSGLGLLKDLKNLQTAKFHESSQWMNKEDALWMLEQWPDLDRDSQNLIRRAGKIATPTSKDILFEKLGVRVLRKERRPKWSQRVQHQRFRY